MRYISCLVLLCLFSCKSQQSTSDFTPTFTPSDDPPFKIKEGQQYTFGYLKVLENRDKPDGPIIELPVYIFKSRSENPKKDPIIYTVGGPGYTTMSSAPYMEYYQYLEDRDLILFEQRGTEYAKPHLACPEWEAAQHQSILQELSQNSKDSLLVAAALACRQRLVNEGIDLNTYTTTAIAADMEDLRKTLGIAQWNLLTISYSTKIAQVLMRDYPEGIRSVVMDSPLPLEVSWDEESNQNLLEVTQSLLADCVSDPVCSQAHPDLKNRFFDYLEKITLQPLQVNINDSVHHIVRTFSFQGKDIIGYLSDLSTGEIPMAPQMIEQLLAGDHQFLASALTSSLQAALNYQAGTGGSGKGMRLCVWCAEEWPFVRASVIQAETEKHTAIRGLSPVVFKSPICKTWNVQSAPARENQAVKSNIPTLLISGSYDVATPAKWARQMQLNLSNSHHIIFPGWTHTPTTNWGNSCGMKVARAFFNTPEKRPEIGCWKDLIWPGFAVE